MSVRRRVLDDARHRARFVRSELGKEVRHARLAAGLRIRDVGGAVNRSVSWVSRVERGLVPGASVDEMVVLGAAVGLRLWVSTHPAERAIHDAPQLALLRRLRARIGSGWEWSFEVVVPMPGDRRAADAVIRKGNAEVMVEAFTRLADAQAQLRAVRLKARDLGIGRLVVVVGESLANRRALGEASQVLAESFPLRTRATLAALAAGRDPGADGIVVL